MGYGTPRLLLLRAFNSTCIVVEALKRCAFRGAELKKVIPLFRNEVISTSSTMPFLLRNSLMQNLQLEFDLRQRVNNGLEFPRFEPF